MLSIKTFKKMCLKANTSKSNEIHEYYIKLEETLHELIDEESNELRSQIEIKDELIKTKDEKINKLQRVKQVVEGYNVCYLCTTDEKESGGVYIIGKTYNLQKKIK